MAKLTPKEAQEKHARRLKAATEDMRAGVDRVTEAPTLKAAAKQDKMRARIVASIDSGKWARGLKRVSLEEWKSKMKDKGIARVPEGIDAAAAKTEGFFAELFPFQDSLVGTVKKMPDVTLEDNINRMTSFVRGMSKFTRKG